MENELVLGYWGVRARGQVLRLLLTYTGASWREKTYTEAAQWFENDKKTLGMVYPNLPYIIDGNLKMSETMAIARYIVNRSERKELLGKDIKDQAYVDNMLGVYNDVMNAVAELFFTDNYEEAVAKALEKIKPKLELLNKFYTDKHYALEYVTIVDFFLAELSYYIKEISQELYDKTPFLARVATAINGLDEVKQYYAKEGAIKFPFMPASAKVQPKPYE